MKNILILLVVIGLMIICDLILTYHEVNQENKERIQENINVRKEA